VIDTRTDNLSASEQIAEMKKITSLPVKYIINTHWHYDHILGNDLFKKSYPDALIFAHKNCLKEMEQFVPNALADEPRASMEIRDQFKKELDSGIKADGTILSEYERSRHRQTISDVEQYLKFSPHLYSPPDVVFDSAVTIFCGGLEIQVSKWGNGHTVGDAMVWIPSKKILITGDNLVAPVPYSLGNYVNGQIDVMERINELDVDIIIPGHGEVQYDKKYINKVIELFKTAESRVRECYANNMKMEDCINSVNFDDLRPVFAKDDHSNYAFQNYFAIPVIRAIYNKELNVK
jgi:glyoxylase-like metal-dependent hydrolase (beta-lactamase superfamily II)